MLNGCGLALAKKKKEKIQFTFLVIQPSFCSIYILSIQKTKKNLGRLALVIFSVRWKSV